MLLYTEDLWMSLCAVKTWSKSCQGIPQVSGSASSTGEPAVHARTASRMPWMELYMTSHLFCPLSCQTRAAGVLDTLDTEEL